MTDEMRIDYLDIDKIKPYKRNAKKHPQEQIDQIVKSIEQFGNNDPIAVWGKDNVIVEGHGRYLALRQMGVTGEVPVIHLDHLSDDERRVYGLVHNKLTMNSGFDYDLLEDEFNMIDPEEFDLSDFGFFQDDEEPTEENNPEEEHAGSLKERYLVPPFSVIYGNKPDWLARKRVWVDFGIRSELGRGGDLLDMQGAIQRQTAYTNGGGRNPKPSKATQD